MSFLRFFRLVFFMFTKIFSNPSSKVLSNFSISSMWVSVLFISFMSDSWKYLYFSRAR